MRGGLIAFDVGVGKTYTAIGVIARPAGGLGPPPGRARAELARLEVARRLHVRAARLPRAVIGSNRKQISRGKRKGLITSETDTPEERAEKWSAFQAGLYDVVILSYDALGRTKMNEEALLEYVKPSRASSARSSCASATPPRRRPTTSPSASGRSSSTACAPSSRRCSSCPRATSSTPASPGTTSASTCSSSTRRRVQEQLQARGPRARPAQVHGQQRRRQQARLAARLSRRRRPPAHQAAPASSC
jgi:hypothetical protein